MRGKWWGNWVVQWSGQWVGVAECTTRKRSRSRSKCHWKRETCLVLFLLTNHSSFYHYWIRPQASDGEAVSSSSIRLSATIGKALVPSPSGLLLPLSPPPPTTQQLLLLLLLLLSSSSSHSSAADARCHSLARVGA